MPGCAARWRASASSCSINVTSAGVWVPRNTRTNASAMSASGSKRARRVGSPVSGSVSRCRSTTTCRSTSATSAGLNPVVPSSRRVSASAATIAGTTAGLVTSAS
ncbi:hypothetical protein DMO24_19160 [Modestobacter versicolor]|uniref:Uncharacterized protein n=1 Tax=Modestobacter versicolor TaxID=429133 RepID=A0A323V5G8_9ACTN|nr:hypothetical protein DMO24_19160 [Modestobacter versicolor]